MGNKQRRTHGAKFLKNRQGVLSIVELMVALSLSGIAITLIFYSWKYISTYTISHQRKAIFQTESDRIAQSIAAQIRKTPEVIHFAENDISFLSANKTDTVVYEFASGVLRKNKDEVVCNSKGAKITQFSFEKEVTPQEIGEPNSIMLVLTITFEDLFGNKSVMPLKIKASISPEKFNIVTGKWNF